MNKKVFGRIFGRGALLAAVLGLTLVPFAHAQLFTYGSTGTVATATSSTATATTTAPTSTVTTSYINPFATTTVPTGTLSMPATSTAAATTTVTIVTTTTVTTSLPTVTITPVPVAPSVTSPLMPSAPGSGYFQFNGLIVTTGPTGPTPALLLASSPAAGITPTCIAYAMASSQTGAQVDCPAPVSSSSPYEVDIDASTQLLLSDRTPATLDTVTAGDEINVFGFYENGAIEASIVRDLSKPASGVITTPVSGSISLPAPSLVTPAMDSGLMTTMTSEQLESAISQLATLVQQLLQELAVAANTTTSTVTVSTTTATPTSSASGPMIPYTGY